jgi:thiol-disulfide isomerase/thioredoxin
VDFLHALASGPVLLTADKQYLSGSYCGDCQRYRPIYLLVPRVSFRHYFSTVSAVDFLHALPSGLVLVTVDNQYLSGSYCGECQRYRPL